MKKQCFNPYLPSYEYIPDGEPYVFDGRVYVYGSHDRFGAMSFCENDYVTWSAPEEDLSDWRYEGIIFHRTDDPMNEDGKAPHRELDGYIHGKYQRHGGRQYGCGRSGDGAGRLDDYPDFTGIVWLCCGRRGVCARGRTDGCLRIAVCRRSRRGHFDSPHGVSGLLGKRGQAAERELRVADGADGRDDSAGFGGA